MLAAEIERDKTAEAASAAREEEVQTSWRPANPPMRKTA